MTYAMIMRDYEPLSYHEKIFARLGSMRAYTERLAELNGRTVQSGVNFVYPENLREWKKAGGIGVRFDLDMDGKGFPVICKLDELIEMF